MAERSPSGMLLLRRSACLLAGQCYAGWPLGTGATEAGVRRQLRDWALRRHVLCRIEEAADTGGDRRPRRTCPPGHGDGGLDRHAGSRELRVRLARIKTD